MKVQVLLMKKAFKIKDSPPATDERKCSVKKNGELWVGWHGDIINAWRIVLGVLGIGEDGRPLSGTLDSTASPETVCPTVAKNVCDASPTSSSGFLPSSTIGMERQELEAASDILKDRLLRSDLCKQPASTDKADDRIVEEVMRCVRMESQNVPATSDHAATDRYEQAGPPNPSRFVRRPRTH